MNETELKTQPAPASAEPAVSVPEKSEETVSESTAQQLLSSAKIQEMCAKKSLLHQRIRTVLAVIVAVAALSMIGSISATMHDVQLLTNNASYAVTNLTNTVNGCMIILENYLQRRNICVRSMICLSLLKKEKLTDW